MTSRPPQQDRSRETVQRILAAADAEIGDVGVARAGTRTIAARAGLSVGALYRFFADKDAIVDALARRYLEDVLAPYAATLAEVSTFTDVTGAIDRLVDQAAALQATHPGYYRLTEDLPPEAVDSPAHQVREAIVTLFVDTLRRAGRTEPEPELREVMAFCVETVRHALVRAPASGPARERAIAELQRMISAYLRDRLEG